MADLDSIWIGSTEYGVGKSNPVTSGNLKRWIGPLSLGDAPLTEFDHPVVGGGTASVGSVYATPREISFDLYLEWTSTNPERNLRDAIDASADAFGAGGGVGIFRVDRLDAAAATVSRVIDVRLAGYPQSQGAMDLALLSASYGWARVPVVLRSTGMPLFRDRQAVATDTEALSTASQAWAITNGGYAACGIKLVLSDIVGTWTSITFVNTTTAQTLIWTDNAFANANYFDFFVGADAVAGSSTSVDWNNGAPSATGLGPLTLARGSNSGTCIGVGGTSGTVTIQYRRFWLTV